MIERVRAAGAQARIAAATAIITSLAILVTVLLTALHSAIDQVQQVRDQLRAHPPATAQDVDRLKTQVGNQVSGLAQDLNQGLADAKNAAKPARTTISVTAPPSKTTKVVLVPQPGPTVTARPTARPVPTPTPSTKPANCLLGLVGPNCPKSDRRATMSEPSAEQPTKAPTEPGSEDFQPLANESVDGAGEPEAQPFQEPIDGGDPNSTEAADVADENLDLAPADNTDHSDQQDDADASG